MQKEEVDEDDTLRPRPGLLELPAKEGLQDLKSVRSLTEV